MRQAVLLLGAAVVLTAVLVAIREVLRSVQRRRWNRQLARCRAMLGNPNDQSLDALVALAFELKQNYPHDVIEAVLEELGASVDDPKVKANLARVFNRAGLLDKYLEALREGKSWMVRANAAEKLGRIGHSRGAPELVATIRDSTEDREVKNIAVRALAKIQDERAVQPLIEVLGESDLASGQPLADAIGQFGDMAVDPLIEVLSWSRKEGQRFWAARILGQLGSTRAEGALRTALGDHSARVRSASADSLGLIGGSTGVGTLCRLLLVEDPVPEVRAAAAQALGKVADERALTPLKESLADLEYAARRRAMEALEAMGAPAVPFFWEALRGDSKEAAQQAAAALERLGMVAERVDALATDEWELAFEQLTSIAQAGIVQVLARSLSHPELAVRVRLCRLLAAAKTPRTFEALLRIASNDSEWPVRLEALRGLALLADPLGSEVLIKALQQEDESIREALLVALREAPPTLLEGLVPAISLLVQDANYLVRLEAMRVLGKLHSEELFEVLLSGLETAGYISIPVLFFFGVLGLEIFILFMTVSIFYGVLVSVASVLMGIYSEGRVRELYPGASSSSLFRYRTATNRLKLVVFAALSMLGYRQLQLYYQLRGFIDWLRGERGWGKFKRHKL